MLFIHKTYLFFLSSWPWSLTDLCFWAYTHTALRSPLIVFKFDTSQFHCGLYLKTWKVKIKINIPFHWPFWVKNLFVPENKRPLKSVAHFSILTLLPKFSAKFSGHTVFFILSGRHSFCITESAGIPNSYTNVFEHLSWFKAEKWQS